MVKRKSKRLTTWTGTPDLIKFIKENMALKVVYYNPENPEEIRTATNVPVLMHIDSEILILYPDKIRIIPWSLILEVTFPFNEKLLKFAMIGSRAMERGMDMVEKGSIKKEDDGRGFQ